MRCPEWHYCKSYLILSYLLKPFHSAMPTSDSQFSYKCRGQRCTSVFDHREKRIRHEKRCDKPRAEVLSQPVALEDGTLQCSTCSRTYASPSIFSRHKHKCAEYALKKIAPQKATTCNTFGKEFKYPSHLTANLKVHTDKTEKTKFLCNVCPKEFVRHDFYQKHIHQCLIRFHTSISTNNAAIPGPSKPTASSSTNIEVTPGDFDPTSPLPSTNPHELENLSFVEPSASSPATDSVPTDMDNLSDRSKQRKRAAGDQSLTPRRVRNALYCKRRRITTVPSPAVEPSPTDTSTDSNTQDKVLEELLKLSGVNLLQTCRVGLSLTPYLQNVYKTASILQFSKELDKLFSGSLTTTNDLFEFVLAACGVPSHNFTRVKHEINTLVLTRFQSERGKKKKFGSGV